MASVQDFINAFWYYLDDGNGNPYYEKASGDARYLTREQANFTANKGSANYTWMGKVCGINPGAWCAMTVSTAVYEACGNDKAAAKEAMWGVWPYSACNQLFDAALPHGAAHYSPYQVRKYGKTDDGYVPVCGDVIVFSDYGVSRTHTGAVYECDGSYVYTIEGNSGNMVRLRSYALDSSYIYGYVNLNLDGSGEVDYTKRFQLWLGVTADGVYGEKTKAAAIKKHQAALGITQTGVWDMLTYAKTARIQHGDKGDEVKLVQGLLYVNGQNPVGIDGQFGSNTEEAVKAFQKSVGLPDTGIVQADDLEKLLQEDAMAKFSDCVGHWAEEYIDECADAGIISGYEDGTFHPDEQITRAETATVFARLMEKLKKAGIDIG